GSTQQATTAVNTNFPTVGGIQAQKLVNGTPVPIQNVPVIFVAPSQSATGRFGATLAIPNSGTLTSTAVLTDSNGNAYVPTLTASTTANPQGGFWNLSAHALNLTQILNSSGAVVAVPFQLHNDPGSASQLDWKTQPTSQLALLPISNPPGIQV